MTPSLMWGRSGHVGHMVPVVLETHQETRELPVAARARHPSDTQELETADAGERRRTAPPPSGPASGSPSTKKRKQCSTTTPIPSAPVPDTQSDDLLRLARPGDASARIRTYKRGSRKMNFSSPGAGPRLMRRPRHRPTVEAKRARPAQQSLSAERNLRWATVLFTVAVILHNGDHLRRGSEHLSPAVFWIGMTGILAEVAIVVLVFARHRLAPAAAAVGGLVLAAGYLQVHFLPKNSVLSDSFTSASHVAAVSWFAASFEILAALVVALTGFAAVSAAGGWSRLRSGPAATPRRLLHPVPMLMVASQAVTVVVALAQVYS